MSTTQAAKRKKTTDMTESPPKRVTRSRAKNTDTDNVALGPKATKITTASAKAAAMKKKSVIPSKSIKRKTRADEQDGEATGEIVTERELKPEPTKAKGRAKKDVISEKEQDQMPDAVNTRVRPSKAPATEVAKPEAPRTRGRPKKALETAPAVQEAQEAIEESGPVKKITRGRSVTNATRLQSTAPATRPAAAAQKKKVKFQQELDKENLPVETEGPKKLVMKPTGLKAKPVRKPAPARAATRGRKVALPTARESRELKTKDVLPLSPKKVNQVAKSDPMISEDELAGEKTQIRALSKPPAKQILNPAKDFGSVLKIDSDQVTSPSSPSKHASSRDLASPARRPPPSPFKDALKSSPKKLQLGDSIAQPALFSSRKPMKASLLQESPRRGNPGNNITQPTLLPSRSPYKTSFLQESPKRVRIEDQSMQPILGPPKSPLKASLLQSPARRPIASPTKSTGLRSPVKSGMKAPAFRTFNSPPKAPHFSLEKVIGSPFQATRSPEQTVKVHTLTDEKCDVETEEDDSPTFHPESPAMDVAVEAEPPLRVPVATVEEPASFDDTIILDQFEHGNRKDETSESPRLAETPTMFKGPAFSLTSATLRRISIESGSEDELASPDKGYGATPLRRLGVSAQDFSTPTVIDGQDSDISEDQLAFTPLADQMSSWAASSPNRQHATNRNRQTRGMFSLGGASMIVAPEQTTDDFPTESPAKSSFFEDEMVMRGGEEDTEDTSVAEMDVDNERDIAALQVSQESQASEEYGDENAMPSDAEILRAEQDHTLTCTPAKVFTPAMRISQQPREIHTVSKVPLRASADDFPLIIARHRSRSFGGPLSVVGEPHQDSAEQLEIHDDAENKNMAFNQPATPMLTATTFPQTPRSAMRLDAETPGRTARKGAVSDVLQGAVVFVDVHTSEGADASGIFVDLLTQMGARCVKQWSWNPRASTGSSLLSSDAPQAASPDTTKVGITHVVYKDGGKRTLEKVRSSSGVVLCVGVGWVLE